jgi:O-antigen ligase
MTVKALDISPRDSAMIYAAYLLAVVVPPLWAFSLTPSPTLLNQLWAIGGWGLVLALHRCVPPMGARQYPTALLGVALGLLCVAVAGSWTLGSLPTSLAVPPLGCLILAAATAALGARVAACAPSGDAEGNVPQAFEPFAWAVLAAGVLSAFVSIVQVFIPQWADGNFIAVSGLPGRSVGNLRQPNHLASLLIWACIALVPLTEWRRIPRTVAALIGALLVFAVLLSGSRTGLYFGVGLLAVWGFADQCLAAAKFSGRDGRTASSSPLMIGAPLLAAIVTALFTVLGMFQMCSRTVLCGAIVLLTAFGIAFEFILSDHPAPEGRMSRPVRTMLIVVPLVAILMWWGIDLWAAGTQHVFGAKERLAEKDVTSSHGAIWKNTVEMIRQQPWTGVGWGEFNFAWTLTPFPDRPTAFFDHTHDLPLQLAVELGLPLSGIVMALLLAALVVGMLRAWRATGPAGHGARAAWMLVVMIGIHSLDEYPLWYVYFLLPAAWAWGFTLGSGPAPRPAGPPVLHGTAGSARLREAGETTVIRLSGDGGTLRWTGLLMIAIAFAAAYDYWRVSTIFAELDEPPLATRILSGQRSLLFAHHADYADATTSEPPSRALGALERATHSLLDARLMMAWANALAESGQLDRARYVAARLREFRKADAEEFFAPCNTALALQAPGAPASAPAAAHGASAPAAGEAAMPFQCQQPTTRLTWHDFH